MGSVPPPIGGDNHAHPHDHDDGGLTDIELRVRALESLMVEKGYVDPAALDAIVETYETKIGPRNGARVVARSWADPTFRRWLADDATAAIVSLGYAGRQGEHMMAVENTAEVHNAVAGNLRAARIGTGRGRERLLPLLARSARKPGRREGRREPGGAGRAGGGVGARRTGDAAWSADHARQRSAGRRRRV